MNCFLFVPLLKRGGARPSPPSLPLPTPQGGIGSERDGCYDWLGDRIKLPKDLGIPPWFVLFLVIETIKGCPFFLPHF